MDAEDEDWDIDAFEQLDNIVAQHQQQKQALGQHPPHSTTQRGVTSTNSYSLSVPAQSSYRAGLSEAQHATASIQHTAPVSHPQVLPTAAGASSVQQYPFERVNGLTGTSDLQSQPTHTLGDSAAIHRLALERDQALAELTSYRRKVEALEREKNEVAHRAGLLGSRAGLGGASSMHGGLGASTVQQQQQMAALQRQLDSVQQQLNHALFEAADASRKVNDKDRRLREAEEQVQKARRQAEQHAAEIAQLQEELRAVQERAAAALRNHSVAFGAGVTRPAAHHHQYDHDNDMQDVQDAAPGTPPANRGGNVGFPNQMLQQPRPSFGSVANYQIAGTAANLSLDHVPGARESGNATLSPMQPTKAIELAGPASGASSRVASKPVDGTGAPSKRSSPVTGGKQTSGARLTPVKDLTTPTTSNQTPVCSIAIPAVNDLQSHRPPLWQKLWSLDAISVQVLLDTGLRAQQTLASHMPTWQPPNAWNAMPAAASRLPHHPTSDSATVLGLLVRVGQLLLQLAPSNVVCPTPVPLHVLVQPAGLQLAAAAHRHNSTQPGHMCIASLVQFLQHATHMLSRKHGSSGAAGASLSTTVLHIPSNDSTDQQSGPDIIQDLHPVIHACLSVLSVLLQHSSDVGDLLLGSVTQTVGQQPSNHSYPTTSLGLVPQTSTTTTRTRTRNRLHGHAITPSAWHPTSQRPLVVGKDTFLANLLGTCHGLLQQARSETVQKNIVCAVADVLHHTATQLPAHGPRQYMTCILHWQLPSLPLLANSSKSLPPLFMEELLNETSGIAGNCTGVGLMSSILEHPGTIHWFASLLQGKDVSQQNERTDAGSAVHAQQSNGEQEATVSMQGCAGYLQPSALTTAIIQQTMLSLLEAIHLDDQLDDGEGVTNCTSQHHHTMPAGCSTRHLTQSHSELANMPHHTPMVVRTMSSKDSRHTCRVSSVGVQRQLLQVCCMLLEAQNGQLLLQCMSDQGHQQGLPGLGHRLLGLAAAAVLRTWTGCLGSSQPSSQGAATLQPVSSATLQQHVQLAEEALLLLREMLTQGSDSLRLAVLEDLASEADSQHGLHNAVARLQEWGSGVLLTPGQRAIPALPLAPWARRYKSTASYSDSSTKHGTLSSSMETIRNLIGSVNKAAVQFMVTQSNAMRE